jgi:dipeptidyl aminopeptidase/acylaminoacyl peptidase
LKTHPPSHAPPPGSIGENNEASTGCAESWHTSRRAVIGWRPPHGNWEWGMIKILTCLFLSGIAWHSTVCAQAADAPNAGAFITPGENFVLENVPPIPLKISEDTARYGESRPAALFDWHPKDREVLIGTRFGDTLQVHAVAMPGGARRQLTFFPDRVSSAKFLPDGLSLIIQKDVGGGEWYQLYRFDLASGEATLLTDGRSRNETYLLAHHSTRVVYTSTLRNNKDDDLWIMDAADPKSSSGAARLLLQVDGGGWAPLAWSRDNRELLVLQSISANESYLWLVDAGSGQKKLLTPQAAGADPSATVAYSAAAFSADGKSIYALSDRGNEFQRLVRISLGDLEPKYLATPIHWDVDQMAPSEDGKSIAFTTNEDGYSKLYLLDTATDRYRILKEAPAGVIRDLQFHGNSHDLGFAVSTAQIPRDIFSIDVRTGKLARWTQGETGGLNPEKFARASLIGWQGFDGLKLSGFLYPPDAARFPGKRPVIVLIHGGPESQERPEYLGQLNYLTSELGVAIVAPNVRGSTGYGKTFLKLDNGFHRDDTYKDINSLLDWVATQPQLDSRRVMVLGGSYGGHMAWAISAFYNERISCAMPVVGMTNLVTFLEHTEAYRRDLRRVEYGDERDPAMREYLEKIAPMNHLDSMRKPIFAIVGKNDPRVPWTESRQVMDKLRAQGTPTWFMVATDEGHGYVKKKNRDVSFDAEVLFINRCLISDAPFGN